MTAPVLFALLGAGYAALSAFAMSHTFPARMAAGWSSTMGAALMASLILPVATSSVIFTAIARRFTEARGIRLWSFAIGATIGAVALWIMARLL